MRRIYLISFITLLITACQSPTKSEQKTVTKIYMPVCAKVSVQCVTSPCPSVEQTFSNLCLMENNKKATLLYEGKCKK